MTKLLEQAIAQVKQLSEPEQDTIAALILEELEDERLWNEAFSSSAQVLENHYLGIYRSKPIRRLKKV